jgi:hypothetical protein
LRERVSGLKRRKVVAGVEETSPACGSTEDVMGAKMQMHLRTVPVFHDFYTYCVNPEVP